MYNNPYNTYNPYNYVPRYNQEPQINNMQPYQNKVTGLNGKVVDSIDVVKATDIQLDGSISYFPIADGSAIATKQLQKDGTSKIAIYKLATDTEEVKTEYATLTDLNKAISTINIPDIKDIKDDIKSLKKQIKGILEDLEEKED